jgi:hypothetical protein
MEYLQKPERYFYSALSVRTRYPPKNKGLLFDSQELPMHHFNKQSAEMSLGLFLAMFAIASPVLACKIMDHCPTGKFYLPSLNVTVQLLGTNLHYPEDFLIKIMND